MSTDRYHPHTARFGASPPRSADTPGRSGQGEEPPRPGSSPNLALALYLARGLAVMALVGVAVLGWAVVLSPAASTAPATPAAVDDAAGRGGPL